MLKFKIIQDPPEILRDYVRFTVVLEDDKTTDSSFNYDVVPMGDITISFAILNWAGMEGGPAGMSFLLATGAMSKINRLMVTPRQVLSMRLKPGAFLALFGVSADRMKNRVIFLEKLWGAEAKGWELRLQQAKDTSERIRVFEEGLVRRRPQFKSPDPYAAAAVDLMEQTDGRITLGELAPKLGYTERQLHRKFEEELGLTPKEFQRVVRCRHLIVRILNKDFSDWAGLADEYGFFDQAHLINEFKAFMGMSPEKFLKKFGAKGHILNDPQPGITEKTVLLGYDGETDPRPPEDFITIDLETVAQQSAAFSTPPAPKKPRLGEVGVAGKRPNLFP